MHPRRLIGLIAIGLVTITLAASETKSTSRPVSTAPFVASEFLEHIKVLASDKLEGRLPGTPGCRAAADYIAAQFAAAGLEPAGVDGSWFQPFEVERGKKLVPAAAELDVAGVDQDWRFERDWIPLPFSGMDPVEGPLAFAGYGIKAALKNYNDYADFDAEGKILLVFRYEPWLGTPDADFGGADPSHYALFSTKARTATRKGAKALIIVNPPLRPGVEDELFEFRAEFAQRTFDIPLIQVRFNVAEAILKQAGLPPLEILERQIDEQHTGYARDLNLNVKINPGVRPNMIRTQNVLGRLPGRGDTSETIVIGGHYDHLGNVRNVWSDDPEPQIHNGADDNASGTAGVIEMARHCAALEPDFRRDVLFMAFGAEEMGLLGSKHFVDHPTIPLDDIKMMINFDMIGRLTQDKFTIFGTTSAAELPDIVNAAAEEYAISFNDAEGLSGGSDHAEFYRNDIPYLFAITGLHPEYHRPTDDWELIDAEGGARILAMFYRIVQQVANMETGPTFQTQRMVSNPEYAKMKPGAEHALDAAEGKPRPDADAAKPARPNVRFGIIPDHSQSAMVVDSVLPGLPAANAGMKSGDRITRIADHKINDIYDYMEVLGSFEPGQALKVVVVRDGAELTLDVKLTTSKHKPDAE
jgi:aminopeptidase YwaD